MTEVKIEMPQTNINSEETRTAATVFKDDLELMKVLARLKFKSDPVNNAWKESIKLFNEENVHLLKEKYDEIKKE